MIHQFEIAKDRGGANSNEVMFVCLMPRFDNTAILSQHHM